MAYPYNGILFSIKGMKYHNVNEPCKQYVQENKPVTEDYILYDFIYKHSGKYKIMCINDGFNVQDEEKVMVDFIKAMDQLFPEKSSFEL